MNLENIILTIVLINTIAFGITKFIFKRRYTAFFCGIIGFSSKKNSNPDKLSLLMLHNSLKRGEDNTGSYSPENGVLKSTKNATDFLSEFEMPKTHLFIGHVRKSSVGSKIEENAHPIEYDNIVLAHNGTLKNYWKMLSDAKIDNKGINTDTQVLTKLLDEDSKKENVVFSTLSLYEGAAALLFTDKRQPDILYAYRNNERPLFWGMVEGSMYISSMEESLKIIGCVETEEFAPLYVHTIKGGKIISSTFYKEKEEPVITRHTNYRPTEYGNITNVKYKNAEDSAEEFVKKIKAAESVNTEKLVDKWVKATIDFDDEYGDETNKAKITKGKWYFIDDSSVTNEFDIQFKDDANNSVWLNKFMFNTTFIGYPNGYCQAVVNIFDLDKNPASILFTKDTIISLAPNAIIDKENKLSCVANSDIFDIEVNCIRPVEDSEVEKFAEKSMKQINEELKGGSQKAINFTDVVLKKDGTNILEFVMNSDREDDAIVILPEMKIVKDDEKESPFVDAETEIIIEPDETEVVVHYILDVLSESIDDIQELAMATTFTELQEKVQEFKDLMDESYNVQMVKETLLDDNQTES